MREFKVLPKIQEFELDLIEKILEVRIPELVRNYLMKYGGCSIKENRYIDSTGLEWDLGQFSTFNDIYGLVKEFRDAYKCKLLPFAYDNGGWHFCLNLDSINYGSIIINRWTDHLPEDQFLIIAENFENFINGLSEMVH